MKASKKHIGMAPLHASTGLMARSADDGTTDCQASRNSKGAFLSVQTQANGECTCDQGTLPGEVGEAADYGAGLAGDICVLHHPEDCSSRQEAHQRWHVTLLRHLHSAGARVDASLVPISDRLESF